MTCIVGIEKPSGGVIIGSDSAGSASNYIEIRRDPKVWVSKGGHFVFGASWNWRTLQVLRYSLEIPIPTSKQTDHEFMCTAFVDAVRRAFHRAGCAERDEDGAESGGQFMVGWRDTLYVVHTNYQVGTYSDGYTAIGSGYQFALGSLSSTRVDMEPRIRARVALDAAVKNCTTVEGPFNYVETS